MALINCPECGEQISDSSSACIHCGYQLRSKVGKEVGEGCSGCILIVILAGIIFWGCDKIVDDKPTSRRPRKTVENSAWDGSVYQVEKWLKANMKDPDSLQFIEWSAVQEVESGFVVRVKYRAKNSFGGYVVENKMVGMDRTGNVLGAQDFE